MITIHWVSLTADFSVSVAIGPDEVPYSCHQLEQHRSPVGALSEKIHRFVIECEMMPTIVAAQLLQ